MTNYVAEIKGVAIKGRGRQRRYACITWALEALANIGAAHQANDVRGMVLACDGLLTSISLLLNDLPDPIFGEACTLVSSTRAHRRLSATDVARLIQIATLMRVENRIGPGKADDDSSGNGSGRCEESAPMGVGCGGGGGAGDGPRIP